MCAGFGSLTTSLLASRKLSAFPTGDIQWNEVFLSTMPCVSTGNFISRGNEHCRAGGSISGYVETMSSALGEQSRFFYTTTTFLNVILICWLQKWPTKSNIRNLIRWLCEPEWTLTFRHRASCILGQAFHWPATSWGVHYTTSCNTQSSAPEDGQNNFPKHVELTGIINEPLLLHLVGCLYYLYQWCTVK